jgi:hypothetical protein
MLILGQSQLQVIALLNLFGEMLLRIEKVLHPSWYRPSPARRNPLDDARSLWMWAEEKTNHGFEMAPPCVMETNM